MLITKAFVANHALNCFKVIWDEAADASRFI